MAKTNFLFFLMTKADWKSTRIANQNNKSKMKVKFKLKLKMAKNCVWVWKISPKVSNISFFSLWIKKISSGSGQKVPRSKAGRPLIYCILKNLGPKISSQYYVDVSSELDKLHKLKLKKATDPTYNSLHLGQESNGLNLMPL